MGLIIGTGLHIHIFDMEVKINQMKVVDLLAKHLTDVLTELSTMCTNLDSFSFLPSCMVLPKRKKSLFN